ncbi:hypothetical protein IPL85_02360 [Candidatus Saccharibacteria bacterium]|nr:MAG: hypothetical protein IPL85_02360 [Candidatus Saccharibacteria bacterium]
MNKPIHTERLIAPPESSLRAGLADFFKYLGAFVVKGAVTVNAVNLALTGSVEGMLLADQELVLLHHDCPSPSAAAIQEVEGLFPPSKSIRPFRSADSYGLHYASPELRQMASDLRKAAADPTVSFEDFEHLAQAIDKAYGIVLTVPRDESFRDLYKAVNLADEEQRKAIKTAIVNHADGLVGKSHEFWDYVGAKEVRFAVPNNPKAVSYIDPRRAGFIVLGPSTVAGDFRHESGHIADRYFCQSFGSMFADPAFTTLNTQGYDEASETGGSTISPGKVYIVKDNSPIFNIQDVRPNTVSVYASKNVVEDKAETFSAVTSSADWMSFVLQQGGPTLRHKGVNIFAKMYEHNPQLVKYYANQLARLNAGAD